MRSWRGGNLASIVPSYKVRPSTNFLGSLDHETLKAISSERAVFLWQRQEIQTLSLREAILSRAGSHGSSKTSRSLAVAVEIFGFSNGRSWADFKKNISGDQIRRFYEVQANLWAADTDWAAIMPAPDGKLRGLYLGDIRPELTLRNLIRFSLYSGLAVPFVPNL